MGQESAKIGQGKAFKEGWIKKDRDILKANVSAKAFIRRCSADGLKEDVDKRYISRTASNNTKHSHTPRSQDSQRSKEAEVDYYAQNYKLQV